MNPIEPTREELIDALRQVQEGIGKCGECGGCIARMVSGILSKCALKPEPKPRRWLVEFNGDPLSLSGSERRDMNLIREVKPLSAHSLVDLILHFPEMGQLPYLKSKLHELGIEVED